MVVSAPVAHDADRSNRQEHREGLPDPVIEAGLADFVEIDRVGLAQGVEPLAGHFAGDADREAGPGEGVAADELRGKPKLASERAHLVLEKLAQGLDELHADALWQAADIVVALDRDGWAPGERHALDHVGIEGALREERDRALAVACDAARLGLERIDEQPADRLALRLRVVEPGEAGEELLRRVDMRERDVVVAAEKAHHLLRLALPHEAVVDKDANQLVADRL